MPSPARLTHDTLFAGKLTCFQHSDGYRFSVDSILLAHFIFPKNESILDLGAGCGVVSLLLAYRHPQVHLTCLELQEPLCALIEKNISANNLESRLDLVRGDLREPGALIRPGSFDYVVCNPPYYRLGTGRENPSDEQAIARHEVMAELADVIAASNFAVKTKGKVALVYPASRAASLLSGLKVSGLEPKRLQVIYPYPGAAASQVLVEAVRCGGEELQILEPLYIYSCKDGDYSSQMKAFYEG